MSIYSNSSHLEGRVELSHINVKGTHPRTIPAMFGLIWFSDFRGDLNVKVYDVRRTPSDGSLSQLCPIVPGRPTFKMAAVTKK